MDIVVSFTPDLVVNYATRNVSLVRNFKLKYHISFVEALGIDRPNIGTVTIDDPIQSVAVSAKFSDCHNTTDKSENIYVFPGNTSYFFAPPHSVSSWIYSQTCFN